MITIDALLSWLVEYSDVDGNQERSLNLVALILVDVLTYIWIVVYVTTGIQNENVAKLVIAVICFVIHWFSNVVG